MRKVLFIVVFLLVFLALASVASAEKGTFYLVAGSYQSLEHAEAQQEKLFLYTYRSKIMGYPIDGVLHWRVVVAQDKERENLEGMKELLKEDGFETFFAYDAPDEPERPIEEPEPIPVPKPEPEQEQEVRAFILELIAWLYEALKKY